MSDQIIDAPGFEERFNQVVRDNRLAGRILRRLLRHGSAPRWKFNQGCGGNIRDVKESVEQLVAANLIEILPHLCGDGVSRERICLTETGVKWAEYLCVNPAHAASVTWNRAAQRKFNKIEETLAKEGT